MNAVDFERHNAEVSEVWDAYRNRRPIRVPLIIGTNTRYFLLGENAPFVDIDFREYTESPDLMFETQVHCQDWLRHHVLQDAKMGLPSEEEGWTVNVDFQNFYEAGWFGCEIAYFDDQVPDTHPRWQCDGTKHEIFDHGLPDPFAGLMGKVRDYYEYFTEKAKSWTYRGRHVRNILPRGLGTDGPLTVAANIRGATEFFTDLVEDPAYAHKLLEFITEATLKRILAWRRLLGQPEKQENFWFADDSIQLISPDMYREFVLPCHKRLRSELSSTMVGGGIHLCGNSSRHFGLIRDELGITSFDTGFPINHSNVRKTLGTEIEILGGPPVETIRSSSPQQVYEHAREILASGIMEGGRFILREGNNLAPGTPLNNIKALYAAARECGQYSYGN